MNDEYTMLGADVSSSADESAVPATGLQPPEATAAPAQASAVDTGSPAPQGSAPADTYDGGGTGAFLKRVRDSWSPGMSTQDRQTARELLHDAGYDFGMPMVDDGGGTLVRDIHTPTINGDSNAVQDDATLNAIDRFLANERAQPGINAQRYAWANSPLHHLGANEVYRDAISQAAAEAGLPRSTIAAVIGAEAAPDAHGTWRADSGNSRSSARGLTQFLGGTWIGEAQRAGTQLNQLARERGYVDRHDKVTKAGQDALLALRGDPAVSIMAAAQYDRSMLDDLSRHKDGTGAPLLPQGLDDDQRARYLYLGHHEGTLAHATLDDTLDWGDAMKEWQANFGPYYKIYPQLDAEHNAGQAYSSRLERYIDDRIKPSNYR